MSSRRGVSLIELVSVIVVVGIAVPALLTVWADISWRSVRSEALSDSALYAHDLMEEVRSKRFDEADEPPWTATAQFSCRRPDETNETGRNLFDDVDDYDNFTETAGPGYQCSVRVDYMQLNGTVWQPAGSVTDFKRIAITVARGGRVNTQVKSESIQSSNAY
jgi:MSHA pilin protein MshD